MFIYTYICSIFVTVLALSLFIFDCDEVLIFNVHSSVYNVDNGTYMSRNILYNIISHFLRATAYSAHMLSPVRLSVCHMGGSVKNA